MYYTAHSICKNKVYTHSHSSQVFSHPRSKTMNNLIDQDLNQTNCGHSVVMHWPWGGGVGGDTRASTANISIF